MLQSGIVWSMLPREFGVSPMSCWRRLHEKLLAELNAQGGLEPRAAVADSTSPAGGKRGDATGPNPTDRGKAGSKQHVLTDAAGTPLTSAVSAANTHDGLVLLPLLDRFPRLRGRRGLGRLRWVVERTLA